MEGATQHEAHQLMEMLGLAACLLVKNLAWYHFSCGRGTRGGFSAGGTAVGRVEKIVIYPVKSCAGVELTSADIATGGLVAPGGLRDRSYLVRSAANAGRFVSLKSLPRLSAVRPLLDPDRPGAILLSAEGQPTIAVRPTANEISVTFRSETLTGLDCGDEVANWLDRVCGSTGFRLVHCPDSERDAMRPRMRQIGDEAGAAASPDNLVAFADAAPVLLLSDKSMQSLNERLAKELPSYATTVNWRNFRPNLVVSGVDQPHAEDTWGRVRIESAQHARGAAPQLSVAFPCERCAMVNLAYSAEGDAKTPQGNPVLGTLAPYRSWRPFQNPLFGVNCAVLAPGDVAIGDRVFADFAAPAAAGSQ